MTKLILHLGDHKTGSTSIQQVLAADGVEAEQSLLFPVGRPKRPHHNHIARALNRKVKRKKHHETEARYFANVAAQIRNSDADIAIISAENFETSDPAALAAALDIYLPDYLEDMRLISYIRPHGDRMLSSFAERTKQGLFQSDLTDFHAETLEDGDFTYLPRLEAWRATFGDRFTARPFIRSHLKDGDVVTDFFDWVLEGAGFTVTAPAVSNEKLTVEDLAVLREVQRRLDDVRGAKSAPREPLRALGWRMARMLSSSAGDKGTKLALDRAVVAKVQDSYASDAAAVDAGFFEATPLTDALAGLEDSAVDAPQSIDLAEVISPAAYRVAVGWMQLIHDLYILKPADWLDYFKDNPLRPDALPQPGMLEPVFPGLETEIEGLDLEWEDEDDDDEE